MVVGISIGACYDLKLSYGEAIRFIQNHGVDGIKLVFATPKDLLNFDFGKEELSIVNSFKFKSIHMPFYEIIYENNLRIKKLIEKGIYRIFLYYF
jgi:hypothetical protein